MKITIMDLLPGEEEEVLIKCDLLTPKVMELINELKHQTEENTVALSQPAQTAQKLKVKNARTADKKLWYTKKVV